MKKVTIITPTYNRANLLYNLYESLKKQSNKDFIWLIIDDGSIDNTKEVVEKMIDDQLISIEYIYKDNGGKHTALNLAFKNLKTDLATIVDSDDTLIKDAIKIIISDDKKYERKDLAGFVYLKGYEANKPLLTFKNDEIIANYNDYIINNFIQGDKFEVFYSKILSNYSFDVYDGEKFIGEGYLWSQIGYNHDMVFINKVLYLCEYLDGGLTKLGRKFRLNNPMGGRRHAEEYLKNIYKFKIRFKNAILYIIYSKISKQKIDFKKYKICLFAFIPAIMLKLYWMEKYKD